MKPALLMFTVAFISLMFVLGIVDPDSMARFVAVSTFSLVVGMMAGRKIK